jgi:4a-hydroxytetrahydrobiopterin dehydratase
MRRPARLNEAELAAALQQLPPWSVKDGKLHREFQFVDFSHAIAFMTLAAFSIEKMDHHPEWSNVYNRVSVDLVTHDAGGITQNDLDLAALLESVATKLQ